MIPRIISITFIANHSTIPLLIELVLDYIITDLLDLLCIPCLQFTNNPTNSILT